MELTERQKEHLLAAFLYSDMSTSTLIDVLLIAMTDPKEDVEEWALNGLRTFGEIRRKYKDDPHIRETHEQLYKFLDKVLAFYFENYKED